MRAFSSVVLYKVTHMSAFVIGEVNSGWEPMWFTKTSNVSLLDELCDLLVSSSEDAVFSYEPLEEDPSPSLEFITEDEMQEYIDYRLQNLQAYRY